MASKIKGGNGQGLSKTPASRQAVLDSIQAERREARRARKIKRAMEIQNKVVEEVVAISEPVEVKRDLILELFNKAKSCFVGYGNTHKTLKYIRNSYEMEDVCLEFGVSVAEKMISDAWSEVQNIVSEDVKKNLSNILAYKAASCFRSHGNTHTTDKYISNSWEYADVARNFGESVAQRSVQMAFNAIFGADKQILV